MWRCNTVVNPMACDLLTRQLKGCAQNLKVPVQNASRIPTHLGVSDQSAPLAFRSIAETIHNSQSPIYNLELE